MLGDTTGFTSAQEQALAVPAFCTSATHSISRAMWFRSAQADAGKAARDAGVSATFSSQRWDSVRRDMVRQHSEDSVS